MKMLGLVFAIAGLCASVHLHLVNGKYWQILIGEDHANKYIHFTG